MQHHDIFYHTAKFENSVPGNISDHEINFSSTISKILSITTEVSRIGTSMANSESTPTSGPDLFIYIVAATGIVALLFVVVLLCMVLAYCCSLDRKR